MANDFIDIFEEIAKRYYPHIFVLQNRNLLTSFQSKSFIALLKTAANFLPSFLEDDKLPFMSKIEIDEDALFSAFVFSCIVELHTFLIRIKNSREIADALDVPREEFIADFKEVLLGPEAPDVFFDGTLKEFDNALDECNNYPRDPAQSDSFCLAQ